MMGRTWAAENAITNLKINLFDPGAIRTRMRATAFPGEDPNTLKTPDIVAEKIVSLCLPDLQETGKLYSFRAGKFLSFNEPS